MRRLRVMAGSCSGRRLSTRVPVAGAPRFARRARPLRGVPAFGRLATTQRHIDPEPNVDVVVDGDVNDLWSSPSPFTSTTTPTLTSTRRIRTHAFQVRGAEGAARGG